MTSVDKPLPKLEDLKLEEEIDDSDDEMPNFNVNNVSPEIMSQRNIYNPKINNQSNYM